MKTRKIKLSAALAVLLSSPVSMAQHGVKKKAATAAPGGASSRVEPLRVIGGELYASTVTGQVKQGAIATDFSFTITKAEIVNGRLQLSGDFALGGSRAQMGDHVTAIRCIDFAIRSQREIVFTFAHGDARVISFLEVHNVCVLVVFVDREFGTVFELMGINQNPPVERVRRPEETAANGCRSQKQQNHR